MTHLPVTLFLFPAVHSSLERVLAIYPALENPFPFYPLARPAQQAILGSGTWTFDPVSFAIGLVVAFLLLALFYRYRVQVIQYLESVRSKIDQGRQHLTASVASRYSADVIETAQTSHLFGALASLDDIYVEPRLDAFLAPPDDAAQHPSLSPLQALRAGPRVAVIGRPGSGRTTLLNHLMLFHASQVQALGASARVPVYVYLPVLTTALQDGATGETTPIKGPAAVRWLVQTALSSVSRLVASGAARWLRRQIESGNALLFLDGWDEIPAPQRSAVTSWILQLCNAHPGNRLIVTAGERGFAPLIDAGFVPLRVAIWTNRQFSHLAQRWSAAWQPQDLQPTQSLPSTSYTLLPPTPLEATIELVIQLHGKIPAVTPAARMAQVTDLLLPSPKVDSNGRAAWPLETGHRALGQLAVAAVTQGQSLITREAIQSTVADAMPPPQFSLNGKAEGSASKEELKQATEETERRTLQIVDCCRALTASGAPICSWDSQRFFFTHPLVAAYLAAHHLTSHGSPVVPHADDPAWFDVLRFYVGLAPAEPLVEHLLNVPDDLFLSHLWTAASLLMAAPADNASWRIGLIKRLAQLFVNPRLPTFLRERALQALVDSGEPTVALLFKRAASNPDTNVRIAAVLGLGALAREQDLVYVEAALDDPHPTVRLAGINAVGIMARRGNARALELVIAAMIDAETEVQHEAAEILVDLGPQGQAVLRDGTQDNDLVVRRAAVYGLATLDEPWARELLEKLRREDTEWLVRNAAAEALTRMDAGADKSKAPFDLALPRAEKEPWLIAWAAQLGERIGTGEAALATLVRALAEGDLHIRQAAVETLGRLAQPQTIDALRQAMSDPDLSIRQAALVALEEISRRHDLSIS